MIALLASLALAQDCTVLRGATVHLDTGPAQVSVALRGDRILAVGAGAGAGCAVVDVSGKHVTAGLVEVGSALGLVEVGMESATVDSGSGRGTPIRAANRVSDVYNPRSTLIPIARAGGVTSAVINPSGGRVAGQAGAVDLAGGTQAEAVFAPSVAMVASIGGESKEDGLLELREVLDDARAYARNRAGYERGQSAKLAASRLDLEALQPVLAGRLPLVLGVDRASDLEAVMRFAAEQKVRVVVSGAAEGWLVADALAAANIAVIVHPYVYGAGSFDQVHGREDNAKLLVDAGVKVIFATGSSHFARNLPQLAGNAVRGGLGHEAALRAITRTPAEVFGLGDRGHIAAGAVANVVVWDGDPLEVLTAVDGVWIRGRSVALESRQTLLRDKYLELPGTPLAPLELP